MQDGLTGDWLAWKWEMSPYWRDYREAFAKLDAGTLWPALYDGQVEAADLWDRQDET